MTCKEDMKFKIVFSLWNWQGGGVSTYYKFKRSMAPDSL